MFTFRIIFLLVFAVFFGAVDAQAGDDAERTANRSVLGRLIPPQWLFTRPDYYEFTPLVSNHDPQNEHPGAWEGQDWDVSQWNPQWTPETAIGKFFQARIFAARYMRNGTVPVVELGPTFYKLSALDQRRTLRLLTDQSGLFSKGYSVVELADWWTHDIVGAYTPKGLFLN